MVFLANTKTPLSLRHDDAKTILESTFAMGRLATASRAAILGLCLAQAGMASAASSGWQVNYSGDLNGSVGGGIVVPGGTPMVSMVRGASMSKDMKSMGTAAMSAKVMTLSGQAPSLKQLDVTLEDGTSCRLQGDGSEAVTVNSLDRKTYDVAMAATLSCAGGKTIAVKASVKK
ncbi:hypothetical protein [Spongiibacter tropicus]|uniref:hypothetical protein n=1 Tax=Spongiibacter tropicus TaxID=454602 RepID=UPI0003B5BECD|nr:hypothetical protein [Spongiibacter tropicus]